MTEVASNAASETFTASRGEISQKAGLSVRTVGTLVKRLAAAGLVTVTANFQSGSDGKARAPSTYTLLPTLGNSLPTSGNGCLTLGNGRFRPSLPSNTRKREEDVEEDVEEWSERIWEAYPRKVGKPDGLNEIKKALKIFPRDMLLERTQAFAKVRPDKTDRFTPKPSTWFHQHRFNDDPSTWNSKGSHSGPVLPPLDPGYVCDARGKVYKDVSSKVWK